MANDNWLAAGWPAILVELHREQGAPNAWSEAYRRLLEVSARESARFTGQAVDADDLVAELLIRLAAPDDPLPRGLAAVESEWARTLYLATVVRNTLLTRFRRKAAEQRNLQALAGAIAAVQRNAPLFDVEDLEHLNREIHRLGEDERELLRLKFWDELPLTEIARRKGLTYSNAAVKLHRLIGKLRALL